MKIVLLNYKGVEDTIACLQSLQKISYPNHNIVIVDNASPDDSMERIEHYLQTQTSDEYAVFASPDEAMQCRSSRSKYTLLQTGHNGGYGYGNNIGIKYGLKNGADYVLVLNNDTVVDPNFLEPMVQMCEEDINIGIVSGKIYFYDRPDVIWFNGGKFSPCTGKVVHMNFGEKDIGQKPPEESTFISGCIWLIPRRVFETVGFINEEYFMYVEDLEYCQRVLNRSYKLKVCEHSIVYHNVGSSGGGHLSEFSVYWITKNTYHFIQSNVYGLCKINAYMYLSVIKSMRWLIKRKYKLFKQHWKGIFDAVRS